MKGILSRPQRYWVLATAAILVCGCADYDQRLSGAARYEAAGAEKIAVVSFERVRPPDPSLSYVHSPLSGTFIRVCDGENGTEAIVEEQFVDRLKTSDSYLVIPSDKAGGVYKRMSALSFRASPREILRAAGKELGADLVVMGYLYCYRERKGYSYSVEQPASVAFSIHLIRVSDGAIVWNGLFDETQSSLMENVFHASSFFKGGGKWLTAEELSRQGVDELLKTFPRME